MAGFRHGSDFEWGGDRYDAWLYRPTRGDEPPVVVLAHNIAGEKAWGLPAFARAFAARGIAAFVFDYRTFGDSDGSPRRVVDPGKHVEDLTAALDHVRSLDSVGDSVGLWGSSFGAGHVLSVAAVESVDAVALQTPFLDGRAQTALRVRQAGLRWFLRAGLAGVRDYFRTATFRSPNYVPVAGEPDEFAVLNSPGAKEGYEAIVPDDEEWPNKCAARLFLKAPFYRPITGASEVECPTLVIEGTEDDVVPSGPVEDLVEALPDVERVRYEMAHFEPYVEPAFGRVVERQGEFLEQHLGG